MNENTQKEIEKLRKQISQQEKMASLGLLSAGIAHEIQNPLNFVINFSKVSQKLLKDMQEVLDELGDALPEDSVEEIKEIMSDLEGNMNKIEENGNRASGIVRGILLYSRGKDDEYIPTDLHQLTKEYVWLSYHAVKANNKKFQCRDTGRVCRRPAIGKSYSAGFQPRHTQPDEQCLLRRVQQVERR